MMSALETRFKYRSLSVRLSRKTGGGKQPARGAAPGIYSLSKRKFPSNRL